MQKVVPKTGVHSKTLDMSSLTAREMCIMRFKEWWTIEEISQIVSQLNPYVIQMFIEYGDKIGGNDKLYEILYDIVGRRFLRNIDNDSQKRRIFLELILSTVIEKGIVRAEDIISVAKLAVGESRKSSLNDIADVVELDANNRLCLGLADKLGLPPSVTEKDRMESLPETEVIEPHVPLNPLYDYQYSTGLFIRGMLEGTNMDEKNREVKRKIVAVPTGAGKTRMVVETLIEWLNDKKQSKNPQQRDSKFILWIAQSNELCEQAFSTFRSIFESIGKRGTTLHLHRFWGPGGTLPRIGMDDLLDEKGVIVATIQSLYKIYTGDPSQLSSLARLTSCVIVDEAHHAIADSYSAVLRRMGFNWDNRKQEISEMGIILIGLTATPFRGTGNTEETKRLERRFNGIYFPTIIYEKGIENFEPHALIDCQTFAYTNEDVKIIGEKSYDRDGFIDDADYLWKIESDGPSKKDVVYKGKRNISHRFEMSGTYKITLKIVDNEGESATATTHIRIQTQAEVIPMPPAQKQKDLYHRLIKRKILCDVYHKVLQSKQIDLTQKDTEYMQRFGEFRKETIKSIGKNYDRNKIILDEINRLIESGRRKILFFACSVEHSRQIAMFLKTIYKINVMYVDSKMDLDSRMNAIELFRSGGVEVLCNFNVLTTGFDAPNIDCVFVGRPVKSTLLYTQMVGRGMRGTKSGGTTDMIIVDIDDNFQLKDDANPSVADLGWKIFKEYWKPWSQYQ